MPRYVTCLWWCLPPFHAWNWRRVWLSLLPTPGDTLRSIFIDVESIAPVFGLVDTNCVCSVTMVLPASCWWINLSVGWVIVMGRVVLAVVVVRTFYDSSWFLPYPPSNLMMISLHLISWYFKVRVSWYHGIMVSILIKLSTPFVGWYQIPLIWLAGWTVSSWRGDRAVSCWALLSVCFVTSNINFSTLLQTTSIRWMPYVQVSLMTLPLLLHAFIKFGSVDAIYPSLSLMTPPLLLHACIKFDSVDAICLHQVWLSNLHRFCIWNTSPMTPIISSSPKRHAYISSCSTDHHY